MDCNAGRRYIRLTRRGRYARAEADPADLGDYLVQRSRDPGDKIPRRRVSRMSLPKLTTAIARIWLRSWCRGNRKTNVVEPAQLLLVDPHVVAVGVRQRYLGQRFQLAAQPGFDQFA